MNVEHSTIQFMYYNKYKTQQNTNYLCSDWPFSRLSMHTFLLHITTLHSFLIRGIVARALCFEGLTEHCLLVLHNQYCWWGRVGCCSIVVMVWWTTWHFADTTALAFKCWISQLNPSNCYQLISTQNLTVRTSSDW